MKIYVIRHGETNVNLENKINSLNDDDLNETGVEQAKKVREIIKDINYDLIIASPLTRTKHTAELLNYKNVPIIYDDRLLERDFGIFTKTQISKIDSNDLWDLNPKMDYADAETVTNLIKRIFEFLNEIKDKYSNKDIVLVTHGGASKAISCNFNGIPKDGRIGIYKHDNCQIHEFDL